MILRFFFFFLNLSKKERRKNVTKKRGVDLIPLEKRIIVDKKGLKFTQLSIKNVSYFFRGR